MGDSTRLTPLTDDLLRVLERHGSGPVAVRAIVEALEDRSTAVLIILLAAPFIAPIPLPGLSMPFGAALALLGVRLGLGKRPWLPGFLLRRQLRPAVVQRLISATVRLAGPVERRLRPRWPALFSSVGCAWHGLAIALGAILLIPPFPMPGINALPSLAIVLMALGMMERDGGAVVTGYVVLGASYAYLYLWWDVAMRALGRLPLA